MRTTSKAGKRQGFRAVAALLLFLTVVPLSAGVALAGLPAYPRGAYAAVPASGPMQKAQAQRTVPAGLSRYGPVRQLNIYPDGRMEFTDPPPGTIARNSPEAPNCVGSEFEPNNTMPSAMALGSSTDMEIEANISPAGDVDWYSFPVNSGERIWAYVVTDISTTTYDSLLTLYAPDGTQVQFDDDNGAQTALSSAIVGVTASQTGSYYLKVESKTNTTINPYYLYLNTTPSGPLVPETEPNDTVFQPDLFAYDQVYSGVISSTTDRDVIDIAVFDEDLAVFHVDGDPERDGVQTDTIMDFVQPSGSNPNGTLLTAVDSGSAAGDKISENFVVLINVVGGGGPVHLNIRIKSDNDATTPPVGPNTGTYHFHTYRVDTTPCTFPPPVPTPTFTPAVTFECPLQLQQNSSMLVESGNADEAVCIPPNSNHHFESSYYRAYNMLDYSPAGPFKVTSVDIGVELAEAFTTATTQTLDIRLYKSSSNPPTLASLGAPVATVAYQVQDQALQVVNIPIPSEPVFNNTDILVLEVHAPTGFGPGNTFYIGTNTQPETAPGYRYAPNCDSDITSYDTIGNGNLSLVMRVNGTGTCVEGAATNTPTRTATGSPTNTSTRTNTPPPSNTPTQTGTPTNTVTGTPPTNTPTPITTNTGTSTPTVTGTPPTPTNTPICQTEFPDVPPGSTFYQFVRCLVCRGFISGFPDGTYKPANNVTRGQLAKIVSNTAGFSDDIPVNRQTFADMPYSTDPSSYWIYVERLYAHGVIDGYECGDSNSQTGQAEPCDSQNRAYYRPGNNVTRGQASKIVAGSAAFTEEVPPEQQTYADVPPRGNGSTFWVFIERLTDRLIMSGYACGSPPAGPCDQQGRPYFLPNNTLSRGQAAKIVANTFYPNCETPARR